MSDATIILNTSTPIIRQNDYAYRDFSSPNVAQHVKDTYHNMHTHQTVEYVRAKNEYWGRLDHAEMSVMEALERLEEYVDSSDPDIHIANAYHGYQVAEKIRAAHPDNEWFQVLGLIHDCGKLMGVWGEPSWSTVGDTFPVGCAPVEQNAFGVTSFDDNPDLKDARFNTKLGMYSANCGLENVMMSWGHDEYFYKVLQANEHHLPDEALYMLRYHSFHPWHNSTQYEHLCSEKDMRMLPFVREFIKYDLYSKTDDFPAVEGLKPYYQKLLDKYVPGKLRW